MKADRLAGESFSGPTRTAELEFTGERIVPGKTPEALFCEHEERYMFAGPYVSGKDVLDLACGTGVGTHYLLKAGAARCYGIDIACKAIECAKARYKGCVFVRADATEICLADSSVDVVVSFETIEHVRDQQKFLLECKRILRPNGQLICSTPDRTIYRWHGANPYHVRELTAGEFIDLMAAHFGGLHLFSQAEKFYPFYVFRLLASRALDQMKLKGRAKSILGWKAPPAAVTREFCSGGQAAVRGIRPYRRSLLMKPVYLIAVVRKVLD